MSYFILKYVHVSCVVLSYSLFFVRGVWMMQDSPWLARRWDDPAFPIAFPFFGTPRYWQDRVLELREQIAAMQEPPPTPS